MPRIKKSVVIVDGTDAETFIEIFKYGNSFEVHVDQATYGIRFNKLAINKFNDYSSTGYKNEFIKTHDNASFMKQKFKTLKQAETFCHYICSWINQSAYYEPVT